MSARDVPPEDESVWPDEPSGSRGVDGSDDDRVGVTEPVPVAPGQTGFLGEPGPEPEAGPSRVDGPPDGRTAAAAPDERTAAAGPRATSASPEPLPPVRAANGPDTPHRALYRRWRAQTFAGIVGQEPVVETLRNAVRSGRVAHALLFVGPRGTGKTSMARIVAKALNCTDLSDGEPCDRCPACVSIREGRALDVVEMDAASNNRVDDMRELLSRTMTAPSDLRRKVYIVDEVQRITQGWDVLLRTLEEPPPHVVFIFCTTDASQIRPAVISRVQRFDFRRLSVGQIEGKLRRIVDTDGRLADDDALELVARLAAGGMRDAESMLDQLLASGADHLTVAQVRDLLGLVDEEAIVRFVGALASGDALTGIRLLDDLEERGRDLRSFLDQAVELIRADLANLLGGRSPRTDADTSRLAAAGRALASLDATGTGPGGLRFQLELALLAAPGLLPGDAVAAPVSTAGPGAASPAIVNRPASTTGSPTAPRTSGSRRSAAVADAASPTPEAVLADPPPAEQVPVAPAAEPPTEPEWLAPDVEPSPAPESVAPPQEDDLVPAEPHAPGVEPAPDPESVALRPEDDLAASEPPSSTRAPVAVPVSDPVPADDAASGGDSLALLRSRWIEVVAHLSKHPPTKPLIAACRPISVEDDVVTLGFPEEQEFLRDVAERRRSNLEEGIGHFLGRPVVVRCVATNLEAAAPLTADEASARLAAEARRIFADDLVDAPEVE